MPGHGRSQKLCPAGELWKEFLSLEVEGRVLRQVRAGASLGDDSGLSGSTMTARGFRDGEK